jgi:hypothetical protein
VQKQKYHSLRPAEIKLARPISKTSHERWFMPVILDAQVAVAGELQSEAGAKVQEPI